MQFNLAASTAAAQQSASACRPFDPDQLPDSAAPWPLVIQGGPVGLWAFIGDTRVRSVFSDFPCSDSGAAPSWYDTGGQSAHAKKSMGPGARPVLPQADPLKPACPEVKRRQALPLSDSRSVWLSKKTNCPFRLHTAVTAQPRPSRNSQQQVQLPSPGWAPASHAEALRISSSAMRTLSF